MSLAKAALIDVNDIRIRRLGKPPLGQMPRAREHSGSGGAACMCPIAVALGDGAVVGRDVWFAKNADDKQQAGQTTPAMVRFERAFDDGLLPAYEPS